MRSKLESQTAISGFSISPQVIAKSLIAQVVHSGSVVVVVVVMVVEPDLAGMIEVRMHPSVDLAALAEVRY